MAHEVLLKGIGIFFIVLVVADLLLLTMQRISVLWFWIVLGASAVVAYVIVPRMRKK